MSDIVSELLPESAVAAFQTDGAAIIRGAFGERWLAVLRAGVARNEAEPGAHAEDSAAGQGKGRFFNDYCNWQRIGEYRDFLENSPTAALAARAMGSRTAQLFHEHLLIKEPGTAMRTPWHHDMPYYNVQGRQTVSIWIALDPVTHESCPEFVAGSHRWGKLFYPRLFRSSANYDFAGGGYEVVREERLGR